MTRGFKEWKKNMMLHKENNRTFYFRELGETGSMSPLRGSSFHEGDDATMHAEAIRSALNDVASSSSSNYLRRSGWTSSEDEVDYMDQDDEGSKTGKNTCFREHRGAHYDEFRKLKELQKQRKGSLDEELSDEDGENGKKTNGKCGSTSSSSSSLASGLKDRDIIDAVDVPPPA